MSAEAGSLARAVYILRRSRGLTLATLEEATGIPRPVICLYEKGGRRMPYAALCRLVRAMGLRLRAIQHAQAFDLGLGDVEIEEARQ